MKALIATTVAALGLVSTSSMAVSDQSLRALIANRIQASVEVAGVENCENKCDKSLDRLAYQISATTGQRTFEYQACLLGCNQCTQDLAQGNSVERKHCFDFCKNYDWQGNGILKGVIEPDKACIIGCVIQTCQVICADGTPLDRSPATERFYYPNGGCSIKTEPYSQNADYVPFDSPNSLQGGSSEVAQCCANALSLCEYVGDRDTLNYRNLLEVTTRSCREFVSGSDQTSICAFFNSPQNCGTGSITVE